MSLAWDSSTPAYVDPGTASHITQTTASFTPPVGALLVIMFGNADTAVGQSSAPTNTGGAVTWGGAAAITKTGTNCAGEIWLGTVTSSALMTVTCTSSPSHTDWGFGVGVLTGQTSTQNGATGNGSSASGTPSITSGALVGTSSFVVGVFGNNTNQTVGTPSGTQSLTFGSQSMSFSNATAGSSAWSQWIQSGAAGGTQTINDTAPTSVTWAGAVLELLVSASGSIFVPGRMPLGA